MELKSQKSGAELTVSLSGELNTLTAPELSTLLENKEENGTTVGMKKRRL